MTTNWNPQKQSPLHYKLVEEGAVFESASGWLRASHFGDAEREVSQIRLEVGIADFSWVAKWELKGADVSALRLFLGPTIPLPGRVVPSEHGYLCRVSLSHALGVFDQEDFASIARLNEMASQTGCFHAAERTFGLGCVLVCGPQAAAILRKVTSVDLRDKVFPHLSCAFGPLAAVRSFIVRRDRQDLPGYEIFFSREYSEYLWDAVVQAGKEYHIRPFGFAAAQLMEF